MAQARELRRRIKSVQSTRQITRTMEMVATSKLKRAQDRVVAARPYANALAEVIGDLYAPDLAERFPLLRQPGEKGVKRVALIGVTANRGLCGAFNTNLIREMRRRIADLEGQGAQVDMHLVGRKGAAFFRFTKRPVASQRTDIGERPTAEHAQEIITPLLEQFSTGVLDAVEIVFAKFTSAISTPATTMRILPIAPPDAKAPNAPKADYLLKPSAEAILEELLPLYVRNQVYRALVETTAGFYGSQRTAMKNATDNAGEMLDILKRTYNRARQGQITQELAEIVGGAEALNG
ncbi:MAG TPA: ATP synthase F1 subunit gamma [Gemmatimonadales bacterium]|nr:ATP synthase F1 subunit gamma [Gemmatimonadales bacterium]